MLFCSIILVIEIILIWLYKDLKERVNTYSISLSETGLDLVNEHGDVSTGSYSDITKVVIYTKGSIYWYNTRVLIYFDSKYPLAIRYIDGFESLIYELKEKTSLEFSYERRML